jgi:8-oxo-dGTP pyrophosphatase MutT (NUDIX family)
MDLTIPLEKVTLNIRVAVLVKKEGGFVLEKSKGGYYFLIGGRVKAGETSEEAAKREAFEEIGVSVEGLKLKGIVELFFGPEDKRVQEICFVYAVSNVNDINLAEEFSVYTLEQIESLDFRPQIMKEIIKSDDDHVLHLTMKERFNS